MKNSNSLFSSFLRRFFSATMLSRLAGFGREVAMAASFGVNAVVAHFWMAFRFSHLLRRFFAEGAMHVSFLPYFMQLKEKDPKEAAYFFYEFALWVTLLLVAIVLVADVIMGWLLFYGNVSEVSQQVITFSLILSPSILFITLYGLNTSFLNSENKFFMPAVAPAAVNLLWIGAAFLFVTEVEIFSALQKVAFVLVGGFIIQFLITLPGVIRFFLAQQCRPNRETSRAIRKELLRLVKPILYAMIGVMATQINSALDMLFAKAASPEGPAYIWYAIRIQQLPLALLGVGLATVLLPTLSRQMEKQGRDEAMHYALCKAIVLMLPITAAFLLMGPSIVQLIFGHGKFTQAAHSGTTSALYYYALALLPMTLVLIVASWFYAKKETRRPAIGATFSVAFNLILNTFFVYGLDWGIEGIALATSLSSLFNLTYLFYYLRKEDVRLHSSLLFVLIKTLTATLVAFGGTYILRNFLFGEIGFTQDFFFQVKLFTTEAAFFGLIFLLLSYWFRLRELVS